MKQEISAFEIHCLLKEFEPLLDSKIDQIYQFTKEDFLFQFHKAGYGKILLRIKPKSAYIASEKEKSPEKLMAFCEYLRKKLSQARVRNIRQLGFERIIQIGLDVKEKEIKKYFLYIELFDKGNIVLCNEDNIVLFARVQHKWKDRVIRAKEKYVYPKKEHNFLLLREHNLREIFKDSKEPAVKVLATKLGLGGVFAEELCIISKIDKNKTNLSEKDYASLLESAESLIKKQLDPRIVIRDGKETEAIPFKLFIYKDLEQKQEGSFSSAIEKVLKNALSSPVKIKELEQTENIIKKQQESVEKLEKESAENSRKAELIYEHYQELESLLKQINIMKEKQGWDEIRKELKKNKLIKEIKEKQGLIVFNL